MEGKRPDLLYIASPYSHPDPAVEEQRFKETCCACHVLIDRQLFVFSPIVHCHPIKKHVDEYHDRPMRGDFEYWKDYNLTMLQKCDKLVVLEMIEGWQESKGVTAEIAAATRWMKPIYFFNGETLTSIYERS